MSFSPIGFPAQPRSDLMSRLISQLRSSSDTTRQEAVTGLSADPAKALGGRIWVEDRDGGGSLFILELPEKPSEGSGA